MGRFRTMALPLVGLLVCSGCGDANGVEVADLAGTWTATSAVMTSVADPTVSVDLIALGAALAAEIGATGTISVTTTDPSGLSEIDIGTIDVTGDAVVLTLDGDPARGTIDLDGDRMTLNLTTGVEFDFDDNGTDDPATLRLVMIRN